MVSILLTTILTISILTTVLTCANVALSCFKQWLSSCTRNLVLIRFSTAARLLKDAAGGLILSSGYLFLPSGYPFLFHTKIWLLLAIFLEYL